MEFTPELVLLLNSVLTGCVLGVWKLISDRRQKKRELDMIAEKHEREKITEKTSRFETAQNQLAARLDAEVQRLTQDLRDERRDRADLQTRVSEMDMALRVYRTCPEGGCPMKNGLGQNLPDHLKPLFPRVDPDA